MLCARWFPPPQSPILSLSVLLSLFVHMVSRMMVDETLASGRETLVGVLRSVTRQSAADLLVAEAAGVRSRVLVFGLLGLGFIFM